MIGSTRNIRRTFRQTIAGRDYTIELDHTIFPDGTEDFELEVETGPDTIPVVESYLRKLLKELRIPWKIQRLGKVTRFYRALKRKKRGMN